VSIPLFHAARSLDLFLLAHAIVRPPLTLSVWPVMNRPRPRQRNAPQRRCPPAARPLHRHRARHRLDHFAPSSPPVTSRSMSVSVGQADYRCRRGRATSRAIVFVNAITPPSRPSTRTQARTDAPGVGADVHDPPEPRSIPGSTACVVRQPLIHLDHAVPEVLVGVEERPTSRPTRRSSRGSRPARARPRPPHLRPRPSRRPSRRTARRCRAVDWFASRIADRHRVAVVRQPLRDRLADPAAPPLTNASAHGGG
jgi:hypothetical protein